MKFNPIVKRKLPDGRTANVYPFHICTKGPEDHDIFLDEEDLRTAFNMIPICAHRSNVIVVTSCVLNSHTHEFVLAESYNDAKRFGNSLKVSSSMYLTGKYKPGGHLNSYHRIEMNPIYLEDSAHVRNALCYIPRNSLDMGYNVDEYKWSAYRAMFRNGRMQEAVRPVNDLSYREMRRILKTAHIPRDVPWMISSSGVIEPASYCDYKYAEDAFYNDRSYYLRTLGLVDCKQMEQELVINPSRRVSTEELMKIIEGKSMDKYGKNVSLLTKVEKIPLIKKIYYSHHVSRGQLSRAFGLDLEGINAILNAK